MKLCPWCGRNLEVKALDIGSKLRIVCSRCGFKIKEVTKPEITQPQEEKVIEIKEEEKPSAKPIPWWPFVVGALALIGIVVLLVKVYLV